MKSPHLLNLGNARKVKDNLAGILDVPSLVRIEKEIESNAIALFALGRHHYLFAKRQAAPNWRQKTSRLYYAAYCVARAVRFYATGEYSTEVQDHNRYDRLPNDFPNKAGYVNRLRVLRDDRNMCDYDHLAEVSDLVLGLKESTELVKRFLNDAQTYLRNRGLNI